MMSGTSLDGIDLVCSEFTHISTTDQWSYKILHTAFFPFEESWKKRLHGLIHRSALELCTTHVDYGHYIGECIAQFMKEHDLQGKIDVIGSHGQTIFHQPEKGITVQIGDGAAIALQTNTTVVSNLRTMDVAAGGQGAPIVPIGDRCLFAQHTACLNIGGISNVSCQLTDGTVLGYDICGANLILNALANRLDLSYDASGKIARSGNVHTGLLNQLNQQVYFSQKPPKSLGAKWVDTHILPCFDGIDIPVADMLYTATEHIAQQIGWELERLLRETSVKRTGKDSLLITGGGAHNDYLIDRIDAYSPLSIHIPDAATIDYKEALVMAFYAILRLLGKPNCIHTVTGAKEDVCGGSVYLIRN